MKLNLGEALPNGALLIAFSTHFNDPNEVFVLCLFRGEYVTWRAFTDGPAIVCEHGVYCFHDFFAAAMSLKKRSGR